MGRHIVEIKIEAPGRDQGKVFVLTEMPATVGEKWAMQLAFLLSQAGALAIPADALQSIGMEAVAGIVPSADAVDPRISLALGRALGDESLAGWWDCVKYQHAPNLPLQSIMQGEACQIEEIATITHLRMEVVKLHTAFFPDAAASTTASRSPAIPTGSRPTRTSRPR